MMVLFAAGMVGLATGSFLCLAVDRYQPAFTSRQWFRALLFPASRCAGCRHLLCVGDLVPIYSWCRLRGRCRYCRCKLSRRLLLTEISTALLFSLMASIQPSFALLFFALLLSAALILLSLIDQQHFMLPDAVTLPLLWLGLLYHLLFNQDVAAAVAGALLGWLFLWLLYWGFHAVYRREGVGYGDMKLFAALGAWCGWQALPLIAAIAASIGLALFIYRASGKEAVDWHCRQPFGPCLSLAGWAVFFWQTQTAIPLL